MLYKVVAHLILHILILGGETEGLEEPKNGRATPIQNESWDWEFVNFLFK